MGFGPGTGLRRSLLRARGANGSLDPTRGWTLRGGSRVRPRRCSEAWGIVDTTGWTCPPVRRRGRPAGGQAPAQGHPLLPPSSPPAGLAAALAAAVAQISPAAGAAAIFVGPARPPATGFTDRKSVV